jgi:hypothetical protein
MRFKLVVTLPIASADVVREATGDTGLYKVGSYGFCSFSTKGVGRFKPFEGANPAIKAVRTYEEPVIDMYSVTETF